MKVSEFFWRFHPRRNRFCPLCGECVGNSKHDLELHENLEHKLIED